MNDETAVAALEQNPDGNRMEISRFLRREHRFEPHDDRIPADKAPTDPRIRFRPEWSQRKSDRRRWPEHTAARPLSNNQLFGGVTVDTAEVAFTADGSALPEEGAASTEVGAGTRGRWRSFCA